MFKLAKSSLFNAEEAIRTTIHAPQPFQNDPDEKFLEGEKPCEAAFLFKGKSRCSKKGRYKELIAFTLYRIFWTWSVNLLLTIPYLLPWESLTNQPGLNEYSVISKVNKKLEDFVTSILTSAMRLMDSESTWTVD